jgi:myo-inositol-1(or 4)-monophosphatase
LKLYLRALVMDLKSIDLEVVDVCRTVARFISTERQNFDSTRVEQKEKFNNLVSYVDKESEKKLVTALSRLLPQAGFITEEGTVEQSKTLEYNWIIDPLDGTTNFLHGLPIYAISVGLSYKQEVILGVVHDVVHNESYHAIREGSAYCNDRVIKVAPAKSLSESLLATGFPYFQFDKRDAYLDIIKTFLDKTHGIRRLGSAAMDLAYVASGRLDGFFEYNLNAWDVAAGAFIVQQAGGKVTDFSGGNNFLFGGELCASNTNIHAEMLQVIQENWN